ncbi:DUF1566 domain-containing protein [Rikenella microfusus]|uniref:Bacterial Ig-like domain (Group 2) n=1 Tax=Rikenella microfusus TaxID=28139 RepID=A0A379MNG4_9BACT|nr:DUF1566 domain-containing protein [Rikenella microfusus]SUE33006.1 Bacterial Ig-like domain (group 2) [Rikenella microfusus]
MKKHLLLILSAVLVVTGCKKEKGGDGGNAFVPPAQEQLLQTAYADHEDTGGGFTFTTDAAWTATVDEGQAQVPGQSAVRTKSDARVAETGNNVVWLKLYNGDTEIYEGGSGTVTIRIEMDQNYTGEKRTATITVRSGNHVFTVTVVQEGTKQDGSGNPAPVPVEGIELSETELRLDAGETATLAASVTPENATIKSVTWASSDPQIATVHPVSGLITAVADGTAVVTATSSSNKKVSAGCTVTIGAGEEEPADDPEPEPTENIVVALDHGAGFHDLLTAEQAAWLAGNNTTQEEYWFDENSPYNRLSPKFAVAVADASPENTGIAYDDAELKRYNWVHAYDACKAYTNVPGAAPSGKWRVPTVKELQLIHSIPELRDGFETYDPHGRGEEVKYSYWSAVTMAGTDGLVAWPVWMENGATEDGMKTESRRVRCVRDLDYVVEPEPAPTENIIVVSDNGIAASDQLTTEEVDYLNRTDISAPGHTYDENSPYNKVSPKFALATRHTTLKDHADRNCYWTDAYEICKNYNQAGTGASGTWRLPTLAELQLIRTLYTIDEGEYWENLKGELLVNERHCSGVSKAGDPDKAWFMDPKGFEDENYQKVGFVMPLEKVGGGSAFVRCVRDL